VSEPLRCPKCQHTDFFVVSAGVSYRNGTLVEIYRWPESSDEILDTNHGYHVEQEALREPEVDAVDGPIKAMCLVCLTDMTQEYLDHGREQILPV
jgi:hypothetical protein